MLSKKPGSTAGSVIPFFLLSTAIVSAQAQDCRITIGTLEYDLTSLAGAHTISRTRETPPSTFQDTARFDLCNDLATLDGVAEEDQCKSGTRVCLTQVNVKASENDRVVSVIPIAETSGLNPEYNHLTSPKGLSVVYHGSPYPSLPSAEPIPQLFNLTLLCDTELGDPSFQSYDGAALNVQWSAPAACGFQGIEEPPQDDNDDSSSGGGSEAGESVGSGLGWFFLVLLLAFTGYFALGAYYNYATYGATGADLIPHRDFWRDVPYMARDVLSHLCSSFRPRHTSSRGGYIAV